jgi:TldD protein
MLVLTNWETDKIYLNSEGSRVRSLVPRISFYYMLTALEDSRGTAQRFNQFGGSGGWELVESWSLPESVSEEARVLGRVLREAKAPPRGEIDVVLGSEVVGIVCHESCGHPSEADRILGREAAQAGESFMKPEMIGTRLGSDAVTIVDDPTLQGSYGYYLYDDEGVGASRRELIRSGVLNTFLHNRETAAELGVESNGAARAMGYSREPIVRMANTFMLPGDHSLDELFQDISNGVYIKSFMEWNIDDRRFNQRYVGLEAYAIRRGKLGEMMRNPAIEMTTTGLFNSVDAVSKNLAFSAAMCGKGDPEQDAPVWTGGPEIRLRKVRLGGLTR